MFIERMTNISAKLPLIIILDLDGTIIGNIMPQLMLNELCTELKKHNVSHSFKHKNIQDVLMNGLIRPYFIDCIKRLKEKLPHIEFFIYTASEKEWGTFVIQQIEKVTKIKFNKPIFTRKDCILRDGDISKSIHHITPAIYKTLKRSYPQISLQNIFSQTIVIDNNHVYPDSKEKNKVLLCPTYDYYYVESIPSYITLNEFNKHAKIITDICNKHYDINIYQSYSYFQYEFFRLFVEQFKSVEQKNSEYLKDMFYKRLYKVLIYVFTKKGFTSFDEKVVEYIKRQLDIV